jgi:hypothetical protein
VSTKHGFAHRLESDTGLYVSFCTVCYQTVAKASNEAKLADGEKGHECDGPPSPPPANLKQFEEDQQE